MKRLREVADTCENIKVELHDKIAILTMNRPRAMNALNNQTLEELDRLIAALECASDVWGVILTGEGKAFVAGADWLPLPKYSDREGWDALLTPQEKEYFIKNHRVMQDKEKVWEMDTMPRIRTEQQISTTLWEIIDKEILFKPIPV